MNLNLSEQLLRDTKNAHICIFIANLASWLRYNAAKENPADRNYYEGRYWSYNTLKNLVQYFDFWSTKNIRTIIKHCVDQGLIQVGNFNKHKYDKTCWYTLTDKALEYYPILRDKIQPKVSTGHGDNPLPETANGLAINGAPIPEQPTICSNNTITTSDLNKPATGRETSNPPKTPKTSEVIEAYHEVLPDSPKIKVCGNELTKQIRSMIRNWAKYQKEGKEFSLDSFKDYLKYIQQFYPWFLMPYTTESGKMKRNNLTNITREKNIVRIVNGEFSAF